MGWCMGLGSVGSKGAGWVPAGSLLTSPLAGCLLAGSTGWLAGLIKFATDLLLPWFKGLGISYRFRYRRRVREAGALNGYGAPAVSTPGLGSRASRTRPGGGWAHLRKNDKKMKN